jgi:phenylpropionate dioxygenase-like ring-hydroxylating dioxygenase large terminal subunit
MTTPEPPLLSEQQAKNLIAEAMAEVYGSETKAPQGAAPCASEVAAVEATLACQEHKLKALEFEDESTFEDTTAFGEVVIPEGMTYQQAYEYLMPRAAYFSADAHKEEMEHLFGNSFVPLGYTAELNGENNILTRHIYGRDLLICKDKKGEVRVFYNMCRHRGHRLAKTDCKQNTLICPYHAWRYRLDGSLVTMPRFKTEDGVEKGDFSLKEVPSVVLGESLIMVHFGDEATVKKEKRTLLHDYHGFQDDTSNYPLKDLKVVATSTYTVQSNWKNLIDNFVEYYHLPTVHPGLVQVSTMGGHVCNQKPGKYIGFQTNPLTSAGMIIDPEEKILGGLLPGVEENGRDRCAQFHAVWPNQFWFLFPNHVFSVIVDPISATESRETAVLMVHKDVDEVRYKKELEELNAYYDEVNGEDIGACEEVQKGLAMTPQDVSTLYVMPYEKTIRRFHQLTMLKMDGRYAGKQRRQDQLEAQKEVGLM